MAKSTLRGGETIDLLNQDELRHELGEVTTTWYQEKARGVSRARFDCTGTPATGALTLPANNQRIGPEPGYCWEVQRISASGLATNDTITVYRNTAIGTGQVDILTAARPTIYPKLILGAGEYLLFTGASLAATGEVSLNGEGWELPELDQYKLL